MFYCYSRIIDHLFSNYSAASTGESNIFSLSCNEDRATLIVKEDLNIGQEENGSTFGEEEERTSHKSVKESLESLREKKLRVK